MTHLHIETPLGTVAGIDGDIQRFLGIPYAQAPVGPYRWKPPRPVQPWTGVLACGQFGPDPVQAAHASLRGTGMGEDCLYLNIWAPRERPAKLPVMVWLPGGGFVAGSGSSAATDGASLAASGVIVVTVSYRVGVLGFLAHPELAAQDESAASGNYGLMDIVEALRWVQSNIACFGGDPSQVTAFGVSAGSACISLLLTSRAADGLFQRCILQSPGAGRRLATLDQAMAQGAALLPGSAGDLRSLDASKLLAANARFNPGLRNLTQPRVLRPIVDGGLVQVQERDALRTHAFRAMPMIVGNHLNEGRFFQGNFPAMDARAYEEWVTTQFGERAGEVFDLYGVPAGGAVTQCLGALFADTQFNAGARLLAHSNGPHAPTFRYLFDGVNAQGDATTHTEEIPYVFGGGASAALTHHMMASWVRFAAADESLDWPVVAGDNAWMPAKGEPASGWRAPQLDFVATL